MSFQIKIDGLPGFDTYAQARAHYEKCPERNGTDRAIAPSIKRKHHMGIDLRGNGDIAMRYHGTDVVTYHPDGRVTIQTGGYDTMSTTAFGTKCSPSAVYLYAVKSGCGPYVHLLPSSAGGDWRARCYRLGASSVTLEPVAHGEGVPEWEPVAITPWPKIELDNAAARRALKAFRYHDFAAWARAYVALQGTRSYHIRKLHTHEIMASLAQGPEGWRTLVDARSPYVSLPKVEETIRRVRRAIYETTAAVRVVEVPYLSLDGVRNLVKLQSAYGGSI